MTFRHHLPTRREALIGAGSLFAWSQMPRLARAEGRDPRMLVIVLRGALDGLGAVAPVGDPDWIGLRGDRALVLDGKPPALPLDGFFALNPAMPNLHRLYKAQQATIVHATATPYRERSHFDGQDVLESGIARPGAVDTGWLNRALAELASDGRVDPRGSRVLGVGSVTPLVVRGRAPVLSWVPQKLLPANEDTQARLLDLYKHTDPKLAVALEARMRLAALGATGPSDAAMADGAALPAPGIAGVRAYFAEAAGTAARFLAKPDGPRVGAVGFVGWDTHINEGAASGQLANLLGALDGALAAIETNMGDAWRETVVAIVTEFGRTARINGTNGTDHGTGTVAFLAGGALRGGRVVADWPGLKQAQLYEERDLKPTTDLRAVLKGLLRDHLRVDERALASTVFPDSIGVAPIGRSRWLVNRGDEAVKRRSAMKSFAIVLSLAISTIVLPSGLTTASASKMNGKCCQSSDGGRSYRYRMAMQRRGDPAHLQRLCRLLPPQFQRTAGPVADVRRRKIAMPAERGLCRPLQRQAVRRNAEDVTASRHFFRCLLLPHPGVSYVDTHRPRARIPRQLEWQLDEALSQRARASPA